jgi:hypothetical protein
MTDSATLQTRQINHGQSEVWLEADGKELTPRRTLATNEVNNVTRRHCPSEIFEAFYKQYHIGLGHIASLSVPNLDEIAAKLKLTI